MLPKGKRIASRSFNVRSTVVSCARFSSTLQARALHPPARVHDPMSNSTLLLYRHILKAAARFPSKNRAGLIEEIKTEFREARGVTDAGELKKKITLAKDGLDRMRAFTGASSSSSIPSSLSAP